MSIRVLYVEDEAALARITTDVLSQCGFVVQWIEDGSKALQVFNPASFDICVIDIMMPGLDGYSLVKEIRQKDTAIPIIFLTARSLTEDVVKGFETGCNDYIRKPYSIDELIVRMKALLQRNIQPAAVPQPQDVYTIGHYEFDYRAMELRHDKDKIVLTHLENELLHRLIKNKDAVLKRQEVLLDLWGDDTFFNARSMDVFISRLRKYLSKDKNLSIVNIRGIGYKMIVK
jgi:DNA-binding response OmpR family regulator